MIAISAEHKEVGLITEYDPKGNPRSNCKLLTPDGSTKDCGFDACIPWMDFIDGLRVMIKASTSEKLNADQRDQLKESLGYIAESLHQILNANPPAAQEATPSEIPKKRTRKPIFDFTKDFTKSEEIKPSEDSTPIHVVQPPAE